jgi:hypothetical protein
VKAALNWELQKLIAAEAARRGLAEHVRVKTEGWGRYRLQFSWPDDEGPPEAGGHPTTSGQGAGRP